MGEKTGGMMVVKFVRQSTEPSDIMQQTFEVSIATQGDSNRVHLPWCPKLGFLFWCPIFNLNLSNLFEDQAPVDEIYGCPMFKWIVETWPQSVKKFISASLLFNRFMTNVKIGLFQLNMIYEGQ